MGVMLSPAWRPFAKQLPESPLMRRTIAQYKQCQAGRRARFLFEVSVYVTFITLAIHQGAGMEQGQESQGSLSHMQRAH